MNSFKDIGTGVNFIKKTTPFSDTGWKLELSKTFPKQNLNPSEPVSIPRRARRQTISSFSQFYPKFHKSKSEPTFDLHIKKNVLDINEKDRLIAFTLRHVILQNKREFEHKKCCLYSKSI